MTDTTQQRMVRPAPRSRVSAASLYAHGVCISCLLLQRFGLPLGGGKLFLAVLIVPVLTMGLVAARQTRIRTSHGFIFGLMICSLLASSIAAILVPDIQMRFSFLSLAEFLVIYICFLFEPAAEFDFEVVLPIFLFYARLIAVAAILQFMLQFAHIRLFSFAGIPGIHAFSTEGGYHVVAPIKYGSAILRSNGFFLLEPSLLSQDMAIAIIVDYFIRRRATYLFLYGAALFLSFSGTGILALVMALTYFGLTSPRQLPRLVAFGALACILVGLMALLLPSEFATLAARATGRDASASIRYGAQGEAFKTILNDPRVVVGFGPGASEGFVVTGAMSPVLKLLFDYGILGLVTFAAYMISAIWQFNKQLLTIICLAVFQFGGGYLVFAPYVFLMGLLCIWSKPTWEPLPVRAAPYPPRSYHGLAHRAAGATPSEP